MQKKIIWKKVFHDWNIKKDSKAKETDKINIKYLKDVLKNAKISNFNIYIYIQ